MFRSTHRLLLVSSLFMAVLAASAATRAQEEPDDDAIGDRQLVVAVVNHLPVAEIAEALGRAIQDTSAQGARIVPEASSNAIFITASPDVAERLVKLLKQLDRPQRQVAVRALLVQVHRTAPAGGNAEGEGEPRKLLEAHGINLAAPDEEVLERVEKLDKEGRLTIVNRLRLTTLEQQEAMLQAGENRPVIASYTTGFGGGRGEAPSRFGGRPFTANYQTISVGMLLRVTPRLAGDAIVLKVEFEKSELEPPAAPVGDPEEEPAGPPQPFGELQTTLTSTVTVRSGKATVIGGFDTNSASRRRESVLILTAKVAEP